MCVIQKIFGKHLAKKFSKIDDLTRPLHSHITADDQCLYLFERTSGKGDSFDQASSVVANLKKKPGIASAAEMRYKEQTINRCSNTFKASLNDYWVENATFVPVPPSKAADHPQYDDRMERVCRGMGPEVDVRNLICQDVSMQASHERPAGERITIAELLEHYCLDEALTDPEPSHIAIVDDMLTAGTHYRAMHTILSQRFPNAVIAGVFVARRIFADEDQTDQ